MNRWQTALGFALTQLELPLPPSEAPDPAGLVEALAQAGWSAERIAEHAREVLAAEQPWPHPIPAAMREGCGPAQLHAAVGRVRSLLDLGTVEKRPPSAPRPLNADERRLVADVPPHWGQ
ncbi:MAG TPA: hypothetical protein DCM67_06950 [Propionibacteriaceae bacterium]|nr:hypothetical protein [Propionibacteriaceae bacterium]